MSNGSSELEVAVKNKNIVMAKMLEMDKYDKYQINPLYGSGVAVTERRLLVIFTPLGTVVPLKCQLFRHPNTMHGAGDR